MPVTLDDAPRREFDSGRFVARYFQVLAWLLIAWMIAAPIFFDMLSIDVSFIFLFWAAARLKHHSPAARKWVLGVSGLILLFAIVMLLKEVLFGTDGTTVTIAGRRHDNPPLWLVALVAAPIVLLAAVPFCVLLTSRARRQFSAADASGR